MNIKQLIQVIKKAYNTLPLISLKKKNTQPCIIIYDGKQLTCTILDDTTPQVNYQFQGETLLDCCTQLQEMLFSKQHKGLDATVLFPMNSYHSYFLPKARLSNQPQISEEVVRKNIVQALTNTTNNLDPTESLLDYIEMPTLGSEEHIYALSLNKSIVEDMHYLLQLCHINIQTILMPELTIAHYIRENIPPEENTQEEQTLQSESTIAILVYDEETATLLITNPKQLCFMRRLNYAHTPEINNDANPDQDQDNSTNFTQLQQELQKTLSFYTTTTQTKTTQLFVTCTQPLLQEKLCSQLTEKLDMLTVQPFPAIKDIDVSVNNHYTHLAIQGSLLYQQENK